MQPLDSVVLASLDLAQAECLKRKHSEITPWHLLYGLVKNPKSYAQKGLASTLPQVEAALSSCATVKGNHSLEEVRASNKLSEWLTLASSEIIQKNKKEIGESELLKFLPKILPELKFDYSDLAKNQDEFSNSETPSFLLNLNNLAAEGKLDPVIGRTAEIRAVMEILGRRSKNNPVLVGPAGVGKTAIVEGLAEAIVKGSVPDILKDKVVYSLSMGSLMAGTKFRGEFEERIEQLLKFVKESQGEIILFIDEIHQLVGAGKTDGAMDAANLLKPALARGELHCIGATTGDEYQKYILSDSALDRRFRSVPINEPSKEDAIEILMGIREKFEIHHGIKISDEAIFNAVLLSDQYITDKNLPDKAIDLIDEASAAMKLAAEAMPAHLVAQEGEIRSKKIYLQIEKNNTSLKDEIKALEKTFIEEKKRWEAEVFSMKKVQELKEKLDRTRFELEQAERQMDYERASKIKYSILPALEKEIGSLSHEWVLEKKHIADVISRQTGIPANKILKSKQSQILELESFLRTRVFGQDEALHEIAETLITSHAGLSDETRPLGSFLLKGPSGVGKTETAKALTEFLYSNEKKLIRLDMSEFSEKHSVSKLIGAPAGYVGYDDGGILTEAVRRNPYSTILLDEIEKAHPDFGDILLQILDDGRLTDNKGRTINFQNTILIMTSNSKNLEQDFKPELLGRIDAILTYNPLAENIMDSLIDKELKKLNERLKSQAIEVTLDDEYRTQLRTRGYDARYGARPLEAVFNKLVIRPLAKKLLTAGKQKDRIFLKYGEVVVA